MTTKECKRCLYNTSHPLGLVLDEERICSGCRIHEEKDKLDWQSRWRELEDIVRPYRSNNTYDCIVPISGAQDSYYIIHLVKNVLKMNPLLVTYNKYWNTPLGIRNLANLRIKFNCDIIYQNVNPKSVKKIVRETLYKFSSIYWHCIAGQTVFPVQTAVRYKIPLIIWGAHQGLEQVGMFSHLNNVEMTRRYRKDHDLMGYEADDLLSSSNLLTEEDIWQYRYPCDKDLSEIGVRGIYLGNFVRWDPKDQHEKMIEIYDYKCSAFNRTFDTYDFIDCYNYMNFHDLLKQLKCGYSKVTDHASREIRHGRLLKEHAKSLVDYYQSQAISFDKMFFDWIGVDASSYKFLLEQIARKSQHSSRGVHLMDSATKVDNMNFIKNSSLSGHFEDKYIVIGKGYPE